MHGYDFIQDLAVIMMVAGLVGWLCHWLGLSAVVGYLAAVFRRLPDRIRVLYLQRSDDLGSECGGTRLQAGLRQRKSEHLYHRAQEHGGVWR